MRLLLLLLAVASLAACTRDADDAPLETPSALTYNPLGADPAGLPSSDSTAGTFEGYYSAGFEHAGFVPCADTTETWWTEPMPSGAAAEMRARGDLTARYTAAVGDSAGSFGRDVPVFARLRGRLSPSRGVAGGAGYGHLGAYTRTIAVDSVEALVRDTVAADCPAPAAVRP